jgi:hypothetical protein
MTNLYNDNSDIQKNQDMYDNYNGFIFSEDRLVFNKLYMKMKFYEMTKELNGDIVECGVFKASGLLAWLKILAMNEPNSIKKVIGMDFFDPTFVGGLDNDVDKETMQQVFDRVKGLDLNDVSYEGIYNKITAAGFDDSKFELIKGDVIETSLKSVQEKPGLRISILYLDMDIEKPTYAALKNLWNNIVPGGVIVFDEYAYHSWSESNAVDKFVGEMGLYLQSTGVKAPTAYIVK